MAQILDYLGNPIKPPARPETREISAVSLRDRWSGYPSSSLTPQRLTNIFREADWGSLRTQAELFEEMEEKDPHLASVMQTRRQAVLGLEWQVEDASKSAQDKKIAEFCREQLKSLKLKALFTHLLGAIGHGYAGTEILWQTGAQWTIRGFRDIHYKNLTFVNSLAPLVVTEDNWQGVEPKAFQLVYHRYLAKSGHDTRNGVLRICAYLYLFKNYALKDWVSFNEVFGMPLRLGKYDPSATEADRQALRRAISSLGSDAAGIISKNTEIEFVEAVSRLSGATNPYQMMADFCNREMSKAVLGQTLTTDTTGGTGTYAAGAVHDLVREDLKEGDAESLAETIKDQVLLPLVGFNFGWDKEVPGFSFPTEESPDLQADSITVKNLVDAGAGSCIPKSYIQTHFNIPKPEDGEETLQAPTPPPSPPPAPGEPPPNLDESAMKTWLALKSVTGGGHLQGVYEELENLTQAGKQEALAQVGQMLQPVKELIDSGADLPTMRGQLLDLFARLPSEGVAVKLFEALVLANLKGRSRG